MTYLYVTYIVMMTSYVACNGTNTTSSPGHDTRSERQNNVKLRQKVYEELFTGYDSRIPPNFDKGNRYCPNRGVHVFEQLTCAHGTPSREAARCFMGTYEPVKVTIQLHILSIDTISEANMDFSMGMFLRQRWNDSRLAYTPIPGVKSLELDTISMTKAWIPDLFIATEKEAEVHQVTVPNKLMHVYPSGSIHYSQRISAKLKCQFDLRTFPLDTQHCAVEMESYSYTIRTLAFQWHDDPVQTAKQLLIPQFSLETITSSQCDKTYVGSGYTCVRFDFWMQRSLGYYVTQVYIPSILIVILSWVSFWLDIDAVPARISLGLLTVLTMTTQSTGVRQGLPKVSYVKGIDIWMAMCLLFVFSGLVQFAYVNVLSRVAKRRKVSMPTIANMAVGINMAKKANDDDQDNDDTPGHGKRKSALLPVRRKFSSFLSADREKARNVDRVSRVAFPAAFAIFNAIYWTVYIAWQPTSDV